MNSKIVAQYLTAAEASDLKKRLEDAGISCTVKRHGLPRLFGGFINYQVQVEPRIAHEAIPLVDSFNEDEKRKRDLSKETLKKQCPVCKSSRVHLKEKRNILEKVMYAGVTVYRCDECRSEWYL